MPHRHSSNRMWIEEHLPAAAARGTDVLVVLSSFRAEGTPRLTAELCRVWLRMGIRPTVAELGRAPDQIGGEFRSLGIPIFKLRVARTGYARYPQLIFATNALCRRLNPDAVLSMPSGIHAFVAIGAKLAGVRRMVVHQGVYPWYWQRQQFRKYWLEYQLGRPFTDSVIACSDYVADGVREHFLNANSDVRTIYNGVHLGKFNLPGSAVANSGQRCVPTIVMVGRLDKTKDHETLVTAVAILRERGVSVRCELVGDGSGQGQLEEQVAQAGLADAVTFLGVRDDVPAILNGAAVFAYCAKREEGLGIALIEAMAAGVPVVASDVPACREVLDDGQLGLLTPPTDPHALADAIELTLKDTQAAQGRAEAAKVKAMRDFSAETMAEQYAAALGLRTGSR